jgi:aminoglycoside phosphotransferase
MNDGTARDPWGPLEGRTPTPPGGVAVPETVRLAARGQPIRLVWRNAMEGLTFEVGKGATRYFVKWTPPAAGPSAADEAARMAWLASYSRVPRVLDILADPDSDATVLITAPLPGESAIADRWKSDPSTAVRVIGQGLRHLHDHAPIESCPFTWSVEQRVQEAHRRIDSGETRPSAWHPEHRTVSVNDALRTLGSIPSVDQLVVCHADACAPNTIIDEGTWSGHVDLGGAGIADRWADLAIATWTTRWNYGDGWEQELLDAYGIEPDPARIDYYRLLWDLT